MFKLILKNMFNFFVLPNVLPRQELHLRTLLRLMIATSQQRQCYKQRMTNFRERLEKKKTKKNILARHQKSMKTDNTWDVSEVLGWFLLEPEHFHHLWQGRAMIIRKVTEDVSMLCRKKPLHLQSYPAFLKIYVPKAPPKRTIF